MPIENDLMMGNYFSNFYNHSSLTDTMAVKEYIPSQAMMSSADNLALGVDADGKLGFFPEQDSIYMAANTAWLSVKLMADSLQDLTAVYLGIAPVAEPEPEPELIPGDVNGDGKVSIKDVTTLIEILLTGVAEDNPDPDPDPDPQPQLKAVRAEYQAADINKDGKVSIKDVTELIDVLLTVAATSNQ